MSQQAPQVVNEVYASFSGTIDQSAVQRIFGGMTTAMTQTALLTCICSFSQAADSLETASVCTTTSAPYRLA